MPWTIDPDVWSALSAILLATISGLIAIANRLAGGQPFSWIWFFSQLGGAVLAGYLMWDAYPYVKEFVPAWCTQPILVSITAHYGGKCFSIAEKIFTRRTGIQLD